MSRPGSGITRAQRMRIYRRDGRTCQLGLPGCTGGMQLEVHHLDGYTPGVHVEDDRLTTACRNCNGKVGRPAGDPEPNQTRTRW